MYLLEELKKSLEELKYYTRKYLLDSKESSKGKIEKLIRETYRKLKVKMTA